MRIHVILIVALAFNANACAQDAPANASALGASRVAVVNGRPVPESVLRVYSLATLGRNLEDVTPQERERLLDDLIGVELLSQQAEKDGLTTSRALAAQIELQRLQLVARAARRAISRRIGPQRLICSGSMTRICRGYRGSNTRRVTSSSRPRRKPSA